MAFRAFASLVCSIVKTAHDGDCKLVQVTRQAWCIA